MSGEPSFTFADLMRVVDMVENYQPPVIDWTVLDERTVRDHALHGDADAYHELLHRQTVHPDGRGTMSR